MVRSTISTLAAISLLGSALSLSEVADEDAYTRISERQIRRAARAEAPLAPEMGTMTRQRRRKAMRHGKPVPQ